MENTLVGCGVASCYCDYYSTKVVGPRADIFFLDYSKREDTKTRPSKGSDKPCSTSLAPFVCWAPHISASDLSYGKSQNQLINNKEPYLCLFSLCDGTSPLVSHVTYQFLMSGLSQYATTFWHSYLLMNNKNAIQAYAFSFCDPLILCSCS